MDNRQLGPHGLHLIQSFETCVLYVYDDLRPPVNGKYREWKGEPVKGTLTAGWGHTDAALSPLKCTLGLRIDQAKADSVLTIDLGECVGDVNSVLEVDVTQGQFDALVSFRFNCGLSNLRKLIVPLNDGNPAATRAKFALYTRSKGSVERGLVRRRAAEQALWDDTYKPDVHAPQSDEAPPHAGMTPDPAKPSKPPAHINPTVIAAGVGGLAETAHQIQETAAQLKETTDAVDGVQAAILAMAHDPWLWIAVAVVFAIGVLWYAHHQHTEA